MAQLQHTVEDDYDQIGTGTVINSAVSNGTYDINGSDGSYPYVTVETLYGSEGSAGSQSPNYLCSWKVILGAFVAVFLLIIGLIAATVILHLPEQKVSGRMISIRPNTPGIQVKNTIPPRPKYSSTAPPPPPPPPPTTTTTSTTTGLTEYEAGSENSSPTNMTEHTTDTSETWTSTSNITATLTPISITTSRSDNQTTSPISVTTENCIGSRECHSCNSFSRRCPANGNMAGTDHGEVMDCPCDKACYSAIRPWNVVQRGCTLLFPLWDEKSRANMTCQEIGDDFLCFCLGDRCNVHDMTVYFQYEGV